MAVDLAKAIGDSIGCEVIVLTKTGNKHRDDDEWRCRRSSSNQSKSEDLSFMIFGALTQIKFSLFTKRQCDIKEPEGPGKQTCRSRSWWISKHIASRI